MICVTIAQESRHLVLADMLNAVQMGADMIEIRLDCIGKAPQFQEMLAAKRRPVLFSCRRPQDGGKWDGTEEERVMLLRQAIMSKADYVEIEYDIADQIRLFPGCQRVISYTNTQKMPSAIGDIYDDMLTMNPDVIRLTVRAKTPEEAWPLVQILAKPKVPTIVTGLGRAGVLLAILGKKIGAPWTFAAIEKGSEAYPGEPTIRDLETLYRYRDIGKPTRFVGVCGLSRLAELTCGLLNVAFVQGNLPHRSLPLQVGNLKLFRKVIDAVRLQGILLEEAYFEHLHELAFLDESAKPPVQAADLVMPSSEHGWIASNSVGSSMVAALEATLHERDPAVQNPLHGKVVLLAGTGSQARMIAGCLKERGAALIFAGKDKVATHRLSQIFGGRQLAWEALYTTMHDVLVVVHDPENASENDAAAEQELTIHPGYLRAGMCVLDHSGSEKRSQFAEEARKRGCAIVEPARLLVYHVRETVKRITGYDPGIQSLEQQLGEWLSPEESEA